MSCEIALAADVLLVRWGAPEVPDLERILVEIGQARLKLGKRPVYVAIIPKGVPAPPSEVRSAMLSRMPKVLENVETMYFVLEGSGFEQSFMRSVLAGFVMASSMTRGRLVVLDSLDRALADAAKRHGVIPAMVMKEALGLEFLEAP
jgi:hypothetical protein